MRFLDQLLSSDFLPHGTCYLWNPRIVWLNVVSDAVITVSYYCVPLALVYLVRKRRDLPFNWIFWMFGLFILSCGTTHLMEIWTVWHGTYLLSGLVKALTAAVSIVTALLLIPLIPKAIALPSPEQLKDLNRELERQIAARAQRERELTHLTEKLELRITERTRELEAINQSLEKEIAMGIQTQLALRGSEERTRLIIENALDAVITMDGAGTITGWNPQAEAVFGLKRENVLGRLLSATIVPERYRDTHIQGMRRFFATGEAHVLNKRVEITALHADGHEFPVEISITPIRTGNTITFSAFVRDITERKQAEEALSASQARLGSVIESAMDAILTVDEQQQIVLFNRAAEKMFRYTAKEARGQTLNRFIPERFRAAHGSHVRRFGETGVTNRTMGAMGQLWALRSDGVEFPIEASISQTETGGKKFFTVILRDITERNQAEEALRESQARLTGIIGSATDAILTVDSEQRILLFNTAAENMFGSTASEAIGQSIARFIPQRFRAQHADHIHRFGKTGVTNRAMGKLGPLWGLRANGEEFAIEASISQIESNGKKLFTVIIRDITERKRIEEALRASEERFRLLLDGVKDFAIYMLDPDGHVLSWNAGATRIKGYSSEEIIGQDFVRFYTAEAQAMGKPRQELQEAVAKGRFEEQGLRIRKDGSSFWANIVISPMYDDKGALRGYCKVARDITERRQAEEQIRKLNQELEQRVRERTKELEAANKELEAFTYSVSHDLRAPLRHIAGFSKMLAEECGNLLQPEAHHYLQRIQDGTRRMGMLVDDLLNLARIGRHELRLQVTGLDSIVRDVLADLKPDTEGRAIEWRISSLPYVEGDPALLKVVFQNLLSNALKYTRPRAHAVIEVGREEIDGQPAVFVRDNGVGFNMKYADKLFGVFQRLHRAEDFEGTGVGLATVQRIVQKHGGHIWVQAELDKGAIFYFNLSEAKETHIDSAMAGETS